MHILQAHGMWVGECGAGSWRSPNGFFENRRISAEARRTFGPRPDGSIPDGDPHWRPFIEDTLHTQGYKSGPWGLKVFAHRWHILDDFKPIFILPRRTSGAILESTRRAGFFRWMDDPKLMDFIESGQSQLDLIAAKHSGVEVFLDDVMLGDLSSLEAAVTAAGMVFDPDVAARVLDPAKFHTQPVGDRNDVDV